MRARLWRRSEPRTIQDAREVRELALSDYPAAAALMTRAPLETVLMRSWLDAPPHEISPMQHFVGLYEQDTLQAICWTGANIIPWGFDESGLALLARYLLRQRLIANSLVGDAGQVLGLWRFLRTRYRRPREVRAHQLSMVWQGAAAGSPASSLNDVDTGLSLAQPDDFALVFPASVAMFTEEMGYDPSSRDDYFAMRVRALLAEGDTYVRFGRDYTGQKILQFKADVGARAAGVVQIQGVYVPPSLRGQGLASAAMRTLAQQVSTRFKAAVHLYVNDFNLPAVRAYEKAGFVTVGEYATVLF